MVRYLQSLRQKPKHVRDNIAFGVAGGFTVITALIIFATGSFGEGGLVSKNDREGSPVFSTFFGQIKEQTASAVGSLRQQTEPEAAVDAQPQPNLIDISSFEAKPEPRKEVPIVVVPSASSSSIEPVATTSGMLY